MSMYTKIKRYIDRSVPSIKYLGVCHFAIGLSARFFTYLGMNKIAKALEKKHSRNITDYVVEKHGGYIVKTQSGNVENEQTKVIWTLWWQGLQSAPESVKLTIGSIRRNVIGYDVIVIDSENYNSYIGLPEYIVRKFESGIISIQNFSDILRSGLIAQNGGIWMDANIFVSYNFSPSFGNNSFWTIKNPTKFLWTGFCIGGLKNNPLTKSMFMIFCGYWKENNQLIDYFLIDRIIQACYEESEIIRNMIDSVPVNNTDVMWFLDNLNTKFSLDLFNKVTSSTTVFKLTHKIDVFDKRYTSLSKLLSGYKPQMKR